MKSMSLKITVCAAIVALLCGSAVQAQPIDNAQGRPLKVFILVGQSNMEGHAKVETFPAVAKDPKTADLYKDMVDAEGKPVVCDDVWISYIYGVSGGRPGGDKAGKLSAGWGAQGNASFTKIGPEYTFGISMNKMLGEPILLIKAAWGGKSLHNDFRPPSAGDNLLYPAEKLNDELKAATSFNYKLMIDHVKKVLADPKAVYPEYNPKDGYELAGFVWFQGFNDLVGPYPESTVEPEPEPQKGKRGKKTKAPKDYSEYSRLLACFIRDVRKDLSAPKLPFVIGVLGVGGKQDNPGKIAFRKAMAAPAEMDEFKGSVVNVFTENYWPVELDPVQEKVSKVKNAYKRKNKKDKDNKPKGEELKKARAKAGAEVEALIKEVLNEDEMWLLKNAISNKAYHYHGSAKFHGQAGKAFAEALIELQKSQK